MWNLRNVVMLATKEKAQIGYLTARGKEFNDLRHFNIPMPIILDSLNFHLYITSYEEIKEGDWIRDSIGSIRQADSLDLKSNYPKIIATTDTSLKFGEDVPGIIRYKSLPSIPQSFIIYFIAEYNKGNVIDKVLVEYYDSTGGFAHIQNLKLNPDNTINIKAGKDEHIADIKRMILLEREYRDRTHHFVDEIDLNEWIENNLK